MPTPYPLTLFYDAACPVCALEMDHLRERNTEGRLVFVNVAEPTFDPRPYGVTLAEMNAEIHGQRPDGSMLRGIEVLRLAYAAVGLGWVLQATAWAPLRPTFDAAYRLFARHRVAISRVFGPVITTVRAQRARQRARVMAQRMRDCGSQCEQRSD